LAGKMVTVLTLGDRLSMGDPLSMEGSSVARRRGTRVIFDVKMSVLYSRLSAYMHYIIGRLNFIAWYLKSCMGSGLPATDEENLRSIVLNSPY
jgi:hypothetical protein